MTLIWLTFLFLAHRSNLKYSREIIIFDALKYASIYKYHSVKANSEFLIFLFFLPLGDIYKMMYQAIGVGLILLKKNISW